MTLTKSLAVCLALMAPAPAIAQQTATYWYDQAEELRLPGTEQNLRRALDIHYSLIQQGYLRSLVPYGEIHLEQGDFKTGLRAFEEAAQTGNLYATTRLAIGHAKSEFGDMSQVPEGRDLLERLAVNPNNSRAILGLADIYALGIGVEVDAPKALELLQRLPQDGYALRRIGDLHMSGNLGKVSPDAAITAYRGAISNGRTTARLSLAQALVALERYDEAAEAINTSVASGDKEALYQLVRWHRDGLFGPLSDPAAGLAAMEQLEATGDLSSDDAQKLRVSFARNLLADGEFQKANDAINPAIEAENERALFEVMRWHRDGQIGPLSDPMIAAQKLETLKDRNAIEPEDENNVRVSLAKSLIAEGRYQEASDIIAPAVAANHERASLRYIGWHRDGEFGPLSDAALAAEKTEELLALGTLEADTANSLRVSLASQLLESGRYQEASDVVIPAVEAGDNRAAIRYIGWHRRGEFGPLSDAGLAAKTMEDLLAKGALEEPMANEMRVSLANALLDEERFQEAADALAPALQAKDPEALYRYARWNFEGRFGPISDTAQARTAIEDALKIDTLTEDRKTALRISLANSFIEEENYQAASDAIAPAVDANDPEALYRFARWHLDGSFGPLASSQTGAEAMATLLETGNVDAAAFSSFQLGGRSNASQNVSNILSILESASREGDGAATGALARAYRKNPRLISNSRERHRELLAEYGAQLSPEQRMIEEIYANYDRSNHTLSREKAANILGNTQGEAFAEGMMELRSLERTSYVYVLQAELENLGYFKGFRNGLLNKRTLNAVLALCRDEGIIRECREGPISKEVSQKIVDALGARKSTSPTATSSTGKGTRS